jgi:hypothetical protein
MQQSNEEKRRKIVHDFAKWTALSALRSGAPLKTGNRVYSLIDKANLAVLFDSNRAVDDTEFDRWHEKTVLAFCGAEPTLSVGWAAKLVNVYLKTRVYLAGEGRKGLVSVIHPPIDYGLQHGLKKKYPNRPWKIKRIKDFRSYQADYLPFIQDCRSLARKEGCLLIELEYYWRGPDLGEGSGRAECAGQGQQAGNLQAPRRQGDESSGEGAGRGVLD